MDSGDTIFALTVFNMCVCENICCRFIYKVHTKLQTLTFVLKSFCINFEFLALVWSVVALGEVHIRDGTFAWITGENSSSTLTK